MFATYLFSMALSAQGCVPGTPLEAHAVDGKWWNATVVGPADGGLCEVTYEGFDASWNEKRSPAQLRPRRAVIGPENPPALPAPDPRAAIASCVPQAKVEAYEDGKWWNATVLAEPTAGGTCTVMFDGFAIQWDRTVSSGSLRERRGAGRQTASLPPPVGSSSALSSRVTGCAAGMRVGAADEAGAIHPATIVGPGSQAGNCSVLLDEALQNGAVDGPMQHLYQGLDLPRPDTRMTQLIVVPAPTYQQESEMRALAAASAANAIVFASRYALTGSDQAIAARLCEAGRDSTLCQAGAADLAAAPPAADAELLQLLAKSAPTQADHDRAHFLAEQSQENARAYFRVYAVGVYDMKIIDRICNGDRNGSECRGFDAKFITAYAQNNREIDARNDREAAAERASSEPVNSGFYSTGAGAAGRAYVPSAGVSTATAPIQVQSESDIRRDQARCRAGSGVC